MCEQPAAGIMPAARGSRRRRQGSEQEVSSGASPSAFRVDPLDLCHLLHSTY
jgi:hypothetical protein